MLDKEKAIISDGLSSLAPPTDFFSNQFEQDLARIYKLSSFIDVTKNPSIINISRIYKEQHPLLQLNQ